MSTQEFRQVTLDRVRRFTWIVAVATVIAIFFAVTQGIGQPILAGQSLTPIEPGVMAIDPSFNCYPGSCSLPLPPIQILP